MKRYKMIEIQIIALSRGFRLLLFISLNLSLHNATEDKNVTVGE